MKSSQKKPLINEEWLVVVLGFIILFLITIAPSFMNDIKMLNVASLTTASGWINTGITFLFLLAIVYLSAVISRKSFKNIFLSFFVIFVLTLLAQLFASIPFCKKYGLESVLFAVLFGLIISNFFKVPDWLKPATTITAFTSG